MSTWDARFSALQRIPDRHARGGLAHGDPTSVDTSGLLADGIVHEPNTCTPPVHAGVTAVTLRHWVPWDAVRPPVDR
ncbi:hypothetical protein [Nocardia sp. NBC_00403]|uniref:hypothetical protein n=1 Tax=Nocardia sp. NBC_00403 TaxID=2975990 RepID=UPI002E1AE322